MKSDASCDFLKPPIEQTLNLSPKINTVPALERIMQRRVLYYSDFDIDVAEWKTEQQTINIFTKTLLTALCKCFRITVNSGNMDRHSQYNCIKEY